MITVTMHGLRDVRRAMRQLSSAELPRAMRNVTNDVAQSIRKREEREIKSVFDRPVPHVQRPFWIDRATKEDLRATVRLKDKFSFLERALSPHIPGRPATREHSAFEYRLQQAGYLGANEYMVPSRTMRRDKYGNVTGAMYSKMLADLRVYKEAGFDGNTKRKNRGFMWMSFGKRKYQKRGRVEGIWYIARVRNKQSGALAMLKVSKQPSYGKRFRFHDVARLYARKAVPPIVTAELKRAFARELRRR